MNFNLEKIKQPVPYKNKFKKYIFQMLKIIKKFENKLYNKLSNYIEIEYKRELAIIKEKAKKA